MSVQVAARFTVTNTQGFVISANTVYPDFGFQHEGQPTPPAQIITITNTGTAAGTPNPLPHVPNWTLTPIGNWTASLAVGGTRQFALRPNDNLPGGPHQPVISITGSNNAAVTIRPLFLVIGIPIDPIFSISATPNSPNFGVRQAGYGQVGDITITVTNHGNTSTSMAPLPHVHNFTLTPGPGFGQTMTPGASVTFTMRPNTGLHPGTYDQKFTINQYGGMASATISPWFVVTAGPAQPAAAISLSQPSVDFGHSFVGYPQIEPVTVTVTNIGSANVTLNPFTFNTALWITTTAPNWGSLLAPGASTFFSIRPANGLGAGSHHLYAHLSGGGGVSAPFQALFRVVTEPPRPVTVTFVPNGGSLQPGCQPTRTLLTGERLNQLPEIPFRQDHAFVGWFNTPHPSGGTRITVNSIFGENTTVWARWNTAVDILNLVFDPNNILNANQITLTNRDMNIEISATYHADLAWRLFEWRLPVPIQITQGWQSIEPTNPVHPMRRLAIPRNMLRTGQRYILEVMATDASGNPATISRIFNTTNIDLRHVNTDITHLQNISVNDHSPIQTITVPRDGTNDGLTVAVTSTPGTEQLWELRQTAPYEKRVFMPQRFTGTNFTIGEQYLRDGHEYQLAVNARLNPTDPGAWSVRRFKVAGAEQPVLPDIIDPPFFSKRIVVDGTPIRVMGFETHWSNIMLVATRPNNLTSHSRWASEWARDGFAAINGSFFPMGNHFHPGSGNNQPIGRLLGFHINDGAFVNHYASGWVHELGRHDWRVLEANVNSNNPDNWGVLSSERPYALLGFTKTGNLIFQDKVGSSNFDSNGNFSITNNNTRIDLSDFAFGIGGFNLLTDRQFINNSTFNPEFEAHYSGYERPNWGARRSRTAIGIKDNGNVVLATFFHEPNDPFPRNGIAIDAVGSGARYYDVHRIMWDNLNCTHALMLDGGGSSQISYRDNGIFKSIITGGNRNPWCRISLKTL